LHQCLKYYYDAEKNINGDVKPFTKVESYFANERFFKEGVALKETMPVAISSTDRRGFKSAVDIHVISNSGTNDKVK